MSLLKKVLGFFSNLGSMFIESIVNFRFNSIRTKLIASFLALVFPILVLGIVSNNMAKNSIKELAEGQANSITLATSQYMKLLTENIEEVSLKFLADEDVGDYLSGSSSITEYEVLQLRRSVEAEIQSYTIGGGTISDMLLLTDENRTIKTWGYKGLDLNMEKLLDKEIYQKALETGGRIHWVGYHTDLDESTTTTDLDESTTTAEIAYSISACRLFKDHNNGKALAILVIDIRNDIITNMLENARITDNSELHLITPDGRDISSRGGTLEESILYSSDFYKNDILTLINNEEEPIEEVITKSKKIKIQGTEYHTVYSILPDSHFTLVALVPIDDIFETSNKIRNFTFMLIVIAILFALIIAVYMSTSMGRTINRIRDVAGTAAKGDLTVIPSTNRRDELGLLTTSIASMITNMRQLINRASDITQTVANSASTVSSTSQQVSAVSQEISRAIQEISEGASAQASDAEQSALKMRQLAIKINTVSDNSKSIEHISHDTMDLTQNGLASIEALGEKAKETTEITREIMSDIQKLDENSKSIGKIIKVIGGIADQTNLLALNAAIEAARAGEMGKGFAVVADEVRKLAEQSMNSTREIGNIVKSTQEQTRQAVERAEKTEEIISSQNIAVENAIESFKDISSSMAKLVSSVKEILEGVVEMDADKEHTNLAIQNISAVSEETAASSEEVTASTEEQLSSIEELSQFATELGESAADLKDAISKFKVKKDDEE